MSRFAVTLTVLACAATPALADVVHLKNGRKMDGEVTRRTRDAITLTVRGGSMTLPLSAVDYVEERQRPQDEYAQRAKRVDPTDPESLERLALWASSRGLGDEASDLNSQANGIRLQQRVDAVRRSNRPTDWLDVYRWARHRDFSDEVQLWLLERAEALDPDHLGVRTALRERELEADRREREARSKAEETALRRDRGARLEKLEQHRAERAEQDRLEALEDRLAYQQARIAELEELERVPLQLRRRRNRRSPCPPTYFRHTVQTPGLCPPQAQPLAPEPAPAPAVMSGGRVTRSAAPLR